MSFLATIGSAIVTGVKAIGGVLGLVGTAVKTVANTGVGSLVNVVEEVVGGVDKLVNSVTDTLSTITSPIKNAEDSVVKLAQDLQNNFVGKLVGPIENTYSTLKTLTSAIEQSTKAGIEGYLKIPGEITSALASNAALYNRSTAQTIAGNRSIAKDVLAANFINIAKTPIDDIHQTIGPYFKLPKIDVSDFKLEVIKAGQPALDWVAKASSFLQGTSEEDGLIGRIKNLLIGFVYGLPAIGENIKPGLTYLQQQIAEDNHLELLPIASLFDAIWRETLDQDQAYEDGRRQGFSDARLDVLFSSTYALLSEGDLVKAYYRGIIDTDTFNNELKYKHFSQDRIQILYELGKFIPSPGDAYEWYVRGKIDYDFFSSICQRNGMDEEQVAIFASTASSPRSSAEYTRAYARQIAADKGFLSSSYKSATPEPVTKVHTENKQTNEQADLDWLMHWKDMQPFEWLNAYFRGFASQEELFQAFDSMSYPQELHKTLIEANRPLIQLWMIPDMLASGAFTGDQATEYLKKIGFADLDIEIIKKYGAQKTLGSVAKKTDALQQLSLGNLKTMYQDGIIDGTQYTKGLIEHGYDSEAATLEKELIDTETELKERKTLATQLIAEVNLGSIKESDAIDKLYSLGFTTGEVAIYQKKIKATKATNVKLPSESQLEKMYSEGIIDKETWFETMSLKGYTVTWSTRIFELLFGSA